ncbi:hypothetical protein GQR58_029203 [Nymphon striatum]|nr:hypothetical protein GQR58_029203 [Nymphon striatum]
MMTTQHLGKIDQGHITDYQLDSGVGLLETSKVMHHVWPAQIQAFVEGVREMPSGVDYQSDYVRRTIDEELDELSSALPALLLDGPKGVGKTATATQRAEVVYRLDRPAEAQPVEADPDRISNHDKTVLLDEWQRVPSVWDAVRRQVDRDTRPGQFFLTGSAPTGESHSGAARITNLRMRPLTLQERLGLQPTVSLEELFDSGQKPLAGQTDVRLDDYVSEIVRGGPGIRHLSGRAHRLQLDSYVERIVDHDIPQEGYNVRRPAAILALMRAYAAATSTTTSFEKLRKAATAGQGELHQTTAAPYVELLETPAHPRPNASVGAVA